MTKTTVRRIFLAAIAISLATACGASSSPAPTTSTAASGGDTSSASEGDGASAGGDEFQLSTSDTAGQAHGDHPSAIVATATEAAMRLFVVDPDSGPTPGVVVKLTGPDGHAYYTEETDS